MYTIEEFDIQKSKIMNFIMYKKRTEQEVRNKFEKNVEENLLDDIIEYVKEAGYLSDTSYIERSVQEFIALKNLSIKEVQYKLYSKGINKTDLEDYLYNNKEELEEYEKKSAKNIYIKKKNTMEKEDIKIYLMKKGYKEKSIKQAIEEIEE